MSKRFLGLNVILCLSYEYIAFEFGSAVRKFGIGAGLLLFYSHCDSSFFRLVIIAFFTHSVCCAAAVVAVPRIFGFGKTVCTAVAAVGADVIAVPTVISFNACLDAAALIHENVSFLSL